MQGLGEWLASESRPGQSPADAAGSGVERNVANLAFPRQLRMRLIDDIAYSRYRLFILVYKLHLASIYEHPNRKRIIGK